MDFQRVYELYADVVFSYLKFKIIDDYLVEDIIQETFISVYNNFSRLNEVSSIKSWILTIAHNKMVDSLRKIKGGLVSLQEDTEIQIAYTESPDETLFINQILDRLDATSRQIIYSIYIEKLTYKELSVILGIPEGTVKSKCHYARAKLRDWLKEEIL